MNEFEFRDEPARPKYQRPQKTGSARWVIGGSVVFSCLCLWAALDYRADRKAVEYKRELDRAAEKRQKIKEKIDDEVRAVKEVLRYGPVPK